MHEIKSSSKWIENFQSGQLYHGWHYIIEENGHSKDLVQIGWLHWKLLLNIRLVKPYK